MEYPRRCSIDGLGAPNRRGRRPHLGAGLLALLVLLAAPLTAQTIEGHLLDGMTREPVGAGVLSLLSEDGEVLVRVESDSVGYFMINAPGPGSYYLRAERIGYSTKTDGIFDLGPGGRLEADFYIVTRPVELEGVDVTVEGTDWIAERQKRMLEGQGFFARQETGFGHFITPEELEEQPPRRPHDLFRMIPRIETGNVTGTPGSDGLVAMSCGMGNGFAAYVNGVQIYKGRVWDMRNDISMDDIAAVEVYDSVARIPL